jgi:electron transfer flavoprotein beta subunit
MRIMVCIKAVYDTRLPLVVSNSRAVPDDSQPVYEMSAASRAALEWGLRLKGSTDCQLVVLVVGGQEAESVLRSSLALGVDLALHLTPAGDPVSDLWAAAGQVVSEVQARGIDLVLCGDGAFGPFLAEALNWPQVTRVIHLETSTTGEIHARRLLERGDREEVRGSLPAVITVNPSGCEVTYISQLRQQGAAHLPIERISCPASLPAIPELQQVEINLPKPRPRRMAAPAAGMSAAQRMSFLMGGGQTRGGSKENRLVEGHPEQAAEKILQFLKERGFL